MEVDANKKMKKSVFDKPCLLQHFQDSHCKAIAPSLEFYLRYLNIWLLMQNSFAFSAIKMESALRSWKKTQLLLQSVKQWVKDAAPQWHMYSYSSYSTNHLKALISTIISYKSPPGFYEHRRTEIKKLLWKEGVLIIISLLASTQTWSKEKWRLYQSNYLEKCLKI